MNIWVYDKAKTFEIFARVKICKRDYTTINLIVKYEINKYIIGLYFFLQLKDLYKIMNISHCSYFVKYKIFHKM